MDEACPIFFYPAGPPAYKNHRTFLKACELLKEQEIEDYRVIWTVTGEENVGMKKLKAEAEENKLPIEFIGPVPVSYTHLKIKKISNS